MASKKTSRIYILVVLLLVWGGIALFFVNKKYNLIMNPYSSSEAEEGEIACTLTPDPDGILLDPGQKVAIECDKIGGRYPSGTYQWTGKDKEPLDANDGKTETKAEMKQGSESLTITVNGKTKYFNFYPECTDSDGGINYSIKGTLKFTGGRELTDRCVTVDGRSMIREYACREEPFSSPEMPKKIIAAEIDKRYSVDRRCQNCQEGVCKDDLEKACDPDCPEGCESDVCLKKCDLTRCPNGCKKDDEGNPKCIEVFDDAYDVVLKLSPDRQAKYDSFAVRIGENDMNIKNLENGMGTWYNLFKIDPENPGAPLFPLSLKQYENEFKYDSYRDPYDTRYELVNPHAPKKTIHLIKETVLERDSDGKPTKVEMSPRYVYSLPTGILPYVIYGHKKNSDDAKMVLDSRRSLASQIPVLYDSAKTTEPKAMVDDNTDNILPAEVIKEGYIQIKDIPEIVNSASVGIDKFDCDDDDMEYILRCSPYCSSYPNNVAAMNMNWDKKYMDRALVSAGRRGFTIFKLKNSQTGKYEYRLPHLKGPIPDPNRSRHCGFSQDWDGVHWNENSDDCFQCGYYTKWEHSKRWVGKDCYGTMYGRALTLTRRSDNNLDAHGIVPIGLPGVDKQNNVFPIFVGFDKKNRVYLPQKDRTTFTWDSRGTYCGQDGNTLTNPSWPPDKYSYSFNPGEIYIIPQPDDEDCDSIFCALLDFVFGDLDIEYGDTLPGSFLPYITIIFPF